MARNKTHRITDPDEIISNNTPPAVPMESGLGQMPPELKAGDTPEQLAYYAANFARHQKGETPYDGIDAWRAAGSPNAA